MAIKPINQPRAGNRNISSAAPAAMTENNLQFGESMSVAAFKQMQGSEQLRVMTNPATNKLFFSCGGTTGAVSMQKTLEEIKENPIISEVTSKDTGESFYLLHVDGGLDADLIL